MDLVPEMVGRNEPFSTMYDQPKLRQVTKSGPQTPASKDVRLIDTRSLASSLQGEFEGIRPQQRCVSAGRRSCSTSRPASRWRISSISSTTSTPVSPSARAAGSPGATLAGALATATHGGEYNAPLLVD